ncbi:MAG: DMT family transporter [Pseudomonadaceae bacterium]|nr:DMT family transporter [Pseudomonadaceae bacterium]
MQGQGQGRGVAMICLVIAMALWGSSFIALKVAFAELPAMWVIFGRMALGSVVFLLAWRWRGKLHYRAGDWKYLLGLAACEPCLYFLFEALALQHTSAAQAGMVTALLPLLVAVGAYVFLREQISRTTWAGFLIAMAGAVWLSLAGSADEHASNPVLGNFYELLAMLCAMGYTLILKHLSARYSPFLLTAMVAFVGSVFFLPLAWFSAPIPSSVSPLALGAVVYLGIVVTVGAYGLYNFGLSRLPASQASGFTNLIPVFTLLFAIVLLGERLNVMQMLAAGLVFAGVLLSQWRGSRPLPAGVME